jgi:hypothetical protein
MSWRLGGPDGGFLMDGKRSIFDLLFDQCVYHSLPEKAQSGGENLKTGEKTFRSH